MKVKYLIAALLLPLFSISQGGIRIESGAQFVTHGTVDIVINDGGMTNFGTLNPSESTFSLKGDSDTQHSTILATDTVDFYNLVVAKTNHDVMLDADIAVQNNLYMQGGLLDMNGNNIYLDGLIEGESEETRITCQNDGRIITSAHLNIPNGMNPGNLGLEITSLYNMGETTIKRGHTVQQINNETSIERIFELIPEFDPPPIYDVKLHYFEAELMGYDENTLQQWHKPDSEWTPFPTLNLNVEENWLEVEYVEDFGTITLSQDANLPVDFISFTAIVNEKGNVDLNWAVMNQVNNSHFTIQRSQDGFAFEDWAEVSGAGNAKELMQYYREDPNPMLQTSYYRIKQTDFDGNFSYGPTRSVFIENDVRMSVFPNPFMDEIVISGLSGKMENAHIKLYSGLGTEILHKEISSADASSIKLKDLKDLSPGTYYVVVTISDRQTTHKVIKTKN